MVKKPKLTIMHEESRRHLQRQLKYLETSSRAYDNGDVDEAIRIATTLRVLFHNTKQSTSLFAHLEQERKFYFVSTLESIEEERNRFLKEHCVLIQQNDPPAMIVDGERKPPFSSWGIKKYLPFDLWWNEKILKINDREYTRKDIVILAANKDGGTHVELKINEKTKLLKKGTGRVKYKMDNNDSEKELIDTHFLFLRQFAYEILSIEKIFTFNGLVFKEPVCETITYNGLLRKANTLINEENFEEAKRALASAIEYNPFKKEAYYNIGCVYEELNDDDKAIRNHNKALEIDKSYLEPYYNLANIYYEKKRYELVMEICDNILTIKPDMLRAKEVYDNVLKELKKQGNKEDS